MTLKQVIKSKFLSLCFILHCFLNMVTRQLHVIKVNVWLLHLQYAIIPPEAITLPQNSKLSYSIQNLYKMLIQLSSDLSLLSWPKEGNVHLIFSAFQGLDK